MLKLNFLLHCFIIREYSQLESNQQFTLRRETMLFFRRLPEWDKMACNHGDFVGYRRFVCFLLLSKMV